MKVTLIHKDTTVIVEDENLKVTDVPEILKSALQVKALEIAGHCAAQVAMKTVIDGNTIRLILDRNLKRQNGFA